MSNSIALPTHLPWGDLQGAVELLDQLLSNNAGNVSDINNVSYLPLSDKQILERAQHIIRRPLLTTEFTEPDLNFN